jgi:predicted HTH transcriptional regulator
MKNPWDWDESDLLRLIADGVTETITLDYKESTALGKTDKQKGDISKDVSAFANSAGGTIVYGIVEDNHLPKKLDFGSDPKDITREWLEQVINSTIQRKVPDVRVKQVPLTAPYPGRVAYVVHVPQSPLAAHQASDKRYYKRYNFQSVAMEDY